MVPKSVVNLATCPPLLQKTLGKAAKPQGVLGKRREEGMQRKQENTKPTNGGDRAFFKEKLTQQMSFWKDVNAGSAWRVRKAIQTSVKKGVGCVTENHTVCCSPRSVAPDLALGAEAIWGRGRQGLECEENTRSGRTTPYRNPKLATEAFSRNHGLRDCGLFYGC